MGNEEIVFTVPKRSVHSVFLHCSASDKAQHDNIKTIESWHLSRGFSKIGYHYFISKDGIIHEGRSLKEIPAAQGGKNTGSIAICLHGLKVEKFTKEQFSSLKKLCEKIKSSYSPSTIKFRGHCEVSSKACPVFDYKSVLGLSPEGYIVDSGESRVVMKSASNHTTQTVPKPSLLQIFDKGDRVKSLQQALKDLGFAVLVDGDFGQETQKALIKYQRNQGFVTDGVAGEKTLKALGTLRRGRKGEAVRNVQKQLRSKAVRVGVDGKFGPNTEKGVCAFQTSSKLKVDGVVGTKTKLKLFGPLAMQKMI